MPFKAQTTIANRCRDDPHSTGRRRHATGKASEVQPANVKVRDAGGCTSYLASQVRNGVCGQTLCSRGIGCAAAAAY